VLAARPAGFVAPQVDVLFAEHADSSGTLSQEMVRADFFQRDAMAFWHG
jgi:hypothetical protein